MGADAFKWTGLIAGIIGFIFSLIRGGGIIESLIAGAILGVIVGGLVSIGIDKIRE